MRTVGHSIAWCWSCDFGHDQAKEVVLEQSGVEVSRKEIENAYRILNLSFKAYIECRREESLELWNQVVKSS